MNIKKTVIQFTRDRSSLQFAASGHSRFAVRAPIRLPIPIVALASIGALLAHGPTSSLHAREFNEITNYKSGISLIIEGKPGVDYVFERWYHDPLIDDHGTIYIKESTRFRLAHNERYSEPGDAKPPKGIIRYKVDRDLAYGPLWSTRHQKPESGYELPGFKAPLSFKDLTYAPEFPDLRVAGSTGPVPGTTRGKDAASLRDHWYRGLLDPSGNEWHLLTVGTDQSPLMETGEIIDRSSNMRTTGKDGKIHCFVVNPKTPAIWFEKTTPEAEWYTTPAKAYFIPRVHAQTSYVTDGISIHLADVLSARKVHYRLNGGPSVAYKDPLPVSALQPGPNRLEFFSDKEAVASRNIVRNPGYPSDNDKYAGGVPGNLLWENEDRLTALRTRLKSDPAPAGDEKFNKLLRTRYQIYLNDRSEFGNSQEWFDKSAGQGLRLHSARSTRVFANALVAVVEGLQEKELFAHYAKGMLLENELSIDPVGYELDMNFMCAPSHTERTNLGYYTARPVIAMAHAYQLLKHSYRRPAFPNGLTPIEDLKVRDQLASFVLLSLHDRQGQLYHPGMGISMVSRQIASLVCAMAMPSYDTPYYGTSGFDGSPARSADLPFPDQKATWKELFYTDSVPSTPYPNQVFKMGVHNNDKLPFDLPTISGRGPKPAGSTYGNIQEDGITAYPINSIAYNGFSLMGFVFGVYSNTMRLNPGHGLDLGYLDRYFLACMRGEQPIDHMHKRVDGYYPNPLAANHRHPKELAALAFKECFQANWDPVKADPNAVPYYMLWSEPGP